MIITELHLLQRARLIAYIEKALLNCEPHSSAFALRILGESHRTEISRLPQPKDFFCKTHYGGYPEVASIGYSFGCSFDISQDDRQVFLGGIKRLINRPEKSIKLISGDDIAILGIADGIKKMKLSGDEDFIEIETWLANIVELRRNKNIWSFRLRELALDLLDNFGRLRVSFDTSHISMVASEVAIRRVWSQQFFGTQNLSNEVLNNSIKKLLTSDITTLTDFEESVVWLKAIDEVLNYEIIKYRNTLLQINDRDVENKDEIPMNEQIDVVIITALEKELDAILRHLESPEPIKSKNRVYYKASINHEKENTSYNLVVLSLFNMGNVEAAIATTQAIDVWNPSHIILVGIAGGVQEEHKRYLGDLIIGEQIVGYELGRISGSETQPRYSVLRPAFSIISAAKNLQTEKWVLGAKTKRPDGSTGRTIPTVHFGVVASGEKVVASKEFTEKLKTSWSKLVGIEMEAYGTAMAAYKAETVPGMFMVKGICDWADSSKDDRWQEYAADIAATYAVALLKSKPFESKNRPQAIKTFTENKKYGGKTQILFFRQLGDDWQDLATYFEIPSYKQKCFEKGKEARSIWEWLESRNKLDGLKEALIFIGREDIAEMLDTDN